MKVEPRLISYYSDWACEVALPMFGEYYLLPSDYCIVDNRKRKEVYTEQEIKRFERIESDYTNKKVKKYKKALEKARQFIENGLDLGYIMPPDEDDPASKTLPEIIKALKD